MTGPEHYRFAENLLSRAADVDPGTDIERYVLGAAQVHATLALAAATALNSPHPEGGFSIPDHDQWLAAASACKRPMLTLYREALERLADEDTPVLGEGLGGGAQEELHVRASFAAHTLGRDTCGCTECRVSLRLEDEADSD